MKIVGGQYRGRVLQAPKGQKTRPTSAKVREALFNIIGTPPERILDLFAGSGLVGLEALSRGARFVHFVDSSREACRCIQENIQLLGVEEQTKVHLLPVEKFLRSRKETLDCILLDPPYQKGLVEKTLERLSIGDSPPPALVVAEHESRIELPDVIGRYLKNDFRKYGDTALSFFKPRSPANSLR